jgi:hypothetical protein
MGMCAIYTSIQPPSPEELVVLARSNEAQKYVAHRRTLGRRAVEELVVTCAPPSHAAFARAILERDLWGFLTPAAARGNHAQALQRVHEDLAVPSPVWPTSTELACLVGAPPAHYLGNNLVLLSRELVDAAIDAFARHEQTSEPAAYLLEFLRDVQTRRHALLLHWDYR